MARTQEDLTRRGALLRFPWEFGATSLQLKFAPFCGFCRASTSGTWGRLQHGAATRRRSAHGVGSSRGWTGCAMRALGRNEMRSHCDGAQSATQGAETHRDGPKGLEARQRKEPLTGRRRGAILPERWYVSIVLGTCLAAVCVRRKSIGRKATSAAGAVDHYVAGPPRDMLGPRR